MTDFEIDAVELNPDSPANASVIWLHGLGANGHDFEPIVPHLNLPDDLNVRFVFPHAPEQPVTINGGYVMRAWYDILDQSIDKTIDLAGVEASCHIVTQLIVREIERGIPSSKIILAGFSQGGVIALETGLRHQPSVAGIIALSTYLANKDKVPSGNLPIFIGHGSFDPIVPYSLGQKTRDILQHHGYSVEWHSYHMEHAVNMEEIVAIGKWITQRLH